MVTHHGPLADDAISDLFVYGQYADLLRDGLTPYAEFGFEYPPLALLPVGLIGDHENAFSIAMLACALAAQELARRIAGPPAAWLMCLLPLLCGALARTRFDLFPAALALGGLALLLVRRPAAAGAVLGLGALAKLWPALLVVLGAVWLRERTPAIRVVASAGAVVLIGVAGIVATGGAPGAWDSLIRFHLDRPVQIESFPATLLFALDGSYVTGDPVRPDGFKSNGLAGGHADAVALLAAAAQVAALIAVLALVARRRDRDGLLLGALGAALAFVALGKVLSPQFLLWLLPLAAIVAARGHELPAALVAAAAAVTLIWFPGRYFDLVAEEPLVVTLVTVRNLLLLAALLATGRALARSPRPASAAPSTG